MKLTLLSLLTASLQLTTYGGVPPESVNAIDTLLAKTDKVALQKLKCLAAKNQGQNVVC